MTKITDLESDLAQFKVLIGERLDKLEAAMDSIRAEARATSAAEAEQQHAKLMALMVRSSQPATTTPPTLSSPLHAVSLPPSLTTAPLPPPSGFGAHFCHTASPPAVRTPRPPNPSRSTPLPISFSTSLVSPSVNRANTFVPRDSPLSGTYTVHPRIESFGPRYDYSYTGPHASQPFGFGPSGDRIWTSGADNRLRKLKMPLFDGQDVYGWVYRVERFFDMQGLVTTGEKLRAAVFYMEGQALSWFRWSDQLYSFRTWEQLKGAMFDRFQTSLAGDLYEQFLAIKQEGTTRAYVSLFESLAVQLEGVSEKALEGTFLKGLKADLRNSVRVLQLTSLGQSMRLAVMIDENKGGTAGDQHKPALKSGPARPAADSMSRHQPFGQGGLGLLGANLGSLLND